MDYHLELVRFAWLCRNNHVDELTRFDRWRLRRELVVGHSIDDLQSGSRRNVPHCGRSW